MISRLLSFAVIICAASVYAGVINANDAQTCKELCTSCHGTASFVDERCECYISDGNQKDAECISRIRREANELGLDLVDCEPATAERHARCRPGYRKHIGTHDAHRIADYFMRGGPLMGSPMVAAAPCETDKIVGSSNSQSQPQLMPLQLESADSKQPSEPMTGASNPSSDCVGASPVETSSSMNPSAYYHTPDPFVGAPLPHYPIQSPYSYAHALLSKALHPHTLGIPHMWPALAAHSPLVSFIHPHPYHHKTPYFPIPRTQLLGAAHKPVSSSKIIDERPQMLSSTGPIVQPGYTNSPVVGASSPLQDLLPLLQQAVVEQNALLESISQQLENHAENVGIPRVFYPPGTLKAASPASKTREDCDCSGEKPSAPVVSSAQRKNNCNDGTSMNTSGGGRMSGKQRPPRMSEDIEQPMDNAETVEVTTEKVKREARPDANGRKRKRELKKF